MLIVEVDKIANLDIQDAPTSDLVKIFKICQDLQELCEKEKGIGISAIQAGLPWKIFLVKGDGNCPLIKKDDYGYFINCDYKNIGDNKLMSLEGCLSIRSSDGRLRFFQLERFKKIILNGYRLLYNNGLILNKLEEEIDYSQQGNVFQHEIDHQLGVEGLISTKGKEVFVW